MSEASPAPVTGRLYLVGNLVALAVAALAALPAFFLPRTPGAVDPGNDGKAAVASR